MHQFLHYVAATTFFRMSAKHNVSSQSTFNIALKTLEKLTHFMLTHTHMHKIYVTPFLPWKNIIADVRVFDIFTFLII